MILTYAIIFIFFIILGLIVFYIIYTVFLPKKINEIARMIDNGQTRLAIKKLGEMIVKDERNAYAHFFLLRRTEKSQISNLLLLNTDRF